MPLRACVAARLAMSARSVIAGALALGTTVFLGSVAFAADAGTGSVAVTTRPAGLKISFPGGGSAVKKIPANTRLQVVKEEGDTITVRDSAGLEGTIARADIRVESGSTTSTATVSPGASPSATTSPSAGAAAAADPKLDAAMRDQHRAPRISAREDAPPKPVEPAAAPVSVSAPTPEPAQHTPGQPVTAEMLNKAFGAKLFQDDNLWDDSAKEVARRLDWPQESNTSTQSSYRLYAGRSVEILGTRPYSMVLYARKDKPDIISMVFANKGDFEGLADMRRPRERDNDNDKDKDKEREREKEREEQLSRNEMRERQKANKKLVTTFVEAVKYDAKTIEQTLTSLLGAPERKEFGTTEATREMVLRWNWKSCAILLASPRDEYTALRIVPVDMADDKGKTAYIPGAELRDWLKSCVEKSPNGDVVIRQIPMVNQGPKGFCVPATWERYLRFMDVPADMYILAMAGETQLGGGTATSVIRNNVTALARQYGRRIESIDGTMDLRNIDKYIDKGLPIMWTCYVNEDLEKKFTERNRERERTTDWAPYIESLKTVSKEMRGKRFIDRERGHMRMIVGYNAKTKEIAISDSWGKWAELRWLTLDEAQSITAGDLAVMRW
ncbi:MAG: hypothetical protein ACAI35_21930 [Candidatus Methylacidiphilales bacterium]